MPVEEEGGIRRESVLQSFFGQEAVNGQEITQDAHAAFGSLTAFRNRCGGRIAVGNGGENSQLNGSLHGLGLLVGVYSVEETFRSGLLILHCCGHGFLPLVKASAV